jgi:hypothetical protein
MSADVGGITTIVDGLYDIWASMIEVGIGMYLLWVYAGVGFIVPLFLAVISLCINYFVVGKKMVSYRKMWNEAAQQRIGLTGSALHDMKSLRVMGLGPRLQSLLQNLRIRELHRCSTVLAPFRLNGLLCSSQGQWMAAFKRRPSLHYSVNTQSYHRTSIHGADKVSFHDVFPCVFRQNSAVSPSRGTSG